MTQDALAALLNPGVLALALVAASGMYLLAAGLGPFGRIRSIRCPN